jgi:hypothetical protein
MYNDEDYVPGGIYNPRGTTMAEGPWPPAVSPEKERQMKLTRVYNNTHSVSEVSKLPSTTKYFAIVQDSMTYDSGYGDHGQPDMCTSQLLNLVWFEDDEALEAWVLKAVEERKRYSIVRVEPVKTEVKAVFSVVK